MRQWMRIVKAAMLGEASKDRFELFSDGRTVWINASDGSSIARFGRMGIDIHTSSTDQMNGAPQCLACTHEKTDLFDWRRFQKLIKQHYDIDVNDSYMPKHITEVNRHLLSESPAEAEQLKRMLLHYGGEFVDASLDSDPDLTKLIKRGVMMNGSAALIMTGKPINCHGNAGTLWLDGVGRICTGYALIHNSGQWVQHSWALVSQQIIETTVKRDVYFGFVLDDEESKDFVEDNPPCWDYRRHYVGSSKDSFYHNGWCSNRELPWSTMSEYLADAENFEPIDKEDFLATVFMPPDLAQEVAGDDLRYTADRSNGMSILYDDDTDTQYFFLYKAERLVAP